MKTTHYPLPTTNSGYTLVELIVAVGLFALIMVLASGSYLLMIGINRQVQVVSTGVDNLSFALESMTRSIRTGTDYSCAGGGDCPSGSSSFSFRDSSGALVSYSLSGGAIYRTAGGVVSALTDPSITISSLTFYAFGTSPAPIDYEQPRVTMIIAGSIPAGPNKPDESFTIETAATMRGTDL